jgi:hypothetical protein
LSEAAYAPRRRPSAGSFGEDGGGAIGLAGAAGLFGLALGPDRPELVVACALIGGEGGIGGERFEDGKQFAAIGVRVQQQPRLLEAHLRRRAFALLLKAGEGFVDQPQRFALVAGFAVDGGDEREIVVVLLELGLHDGRDAAGLKQRFGRAALGLERGEQLAGGLGTEAVARRGVPGE